MTGLLPDVMDAPLPIVAYVAERDVDEVARTIHEAAGDLTLQLEVFINGGELTGSAVNASIARPEAPQADVAYLRTRAMSAAGLILGQGPLIISETPSLLSVLDRNARDHGKSRLRIVPPGHDGDSLISLRSRGGYRVDQPLQVGEFALALHLPIDERRRDLVKKWLWITGERRQLSSART